MSELEQFKRWAASVDMPDSVLPRAWMAWQASADRAQPAQAVPASCGECGKKASDGWALYCVACMEKAGLPAVTDSPPLTHSCTSSLGKTPDSTVQAGPLLSDAHIDQITRDQWGAHAQYLHAAYRAYARAVEAAVRAKLGVAVPMTAAGQMFAGAKKAVGVTFRVNPDLDSETVRQAHVAVSEAPPYELPDWQKAALCVCREVVAAWGSEESRAAHGIVGKEGA